MNFKVCKLTKDMAYDEEKEIITIDTTIII